MRSTVAPMFKFAYLAFAIVGCSGAIGGSDGKGGDGSGNRNTAGDGSGGTSEGGTSGTQGNGGAGGSTPADLSFACDPKAVPKSLALPRLSAIQVKNAINDLIAIALKGSATVAAAQAEVAPVLAAWPGDLAPATGAKTRGLYRRMDSGVVTELVGASYRTAEAVGNALTKSDRLSALLGSCASAADSKPCVLELLRRVGPRLLRRSLTAGDETFYMSKYGTGTALDAAALAQVVGILFASPDFFYTVESGTGAANVLRTPLSAMELASKLALHLWNTIPDDALWTAATGGKLLEDATYTAQITRMLADPKAVPVLDEFVSDWLLLSDVPRFDSLKQEARYQSFAAADNAMLTAAVRQAAIDDVLTLTRDLFLTNPAAAATLMQDTRVFPTNPALARIYGVSIWDGKSAPPTVAERPGVLTRMALLAMPTVETHPILRGTFIRQQILGDEIPPPPDNANAVAQMEAVAIPANASTRDRITAITESRPLCAACHQAFINPLGFAMEGFDTLGRKRNTESLFDAAGKTTATPAIDTRTSAQIILDEPVEVADAAGLALAIATTGKLEASLARQYFRFLNRRREVDEEDGCALESLRKSLLDGKTLRDLLVAAVSQPSFKERVFQ
jgi:Protein of unknown function (DUF1592)/Protein of unknown function (DUF1588)